jgi:hypothetical protein
MNFKYFLKPINWLLSLKQSLFDLKPQIRPKANGFQGLYKFRLPAGNTHFKNGLNSTFLVKLTLLAF